ncbi:hypothetical protein CUN67_24400 (plasmid) [Pantoea cypripedii]|uniref:Uncharacterized protein n=2 Tax=Pantoea cypripedii TaxID=55209 RepID=A0A6B9GD53_PANCY|nr:hypothetical protein CUN67_24400 [Pantoea cypripedii]
MGMVTVSETLEGLNLSLKEMEAKIKEIDVKLAANTFIESTSKALLSLADAAVTTASAAVSDTGSVPAITKIVMTTKDIFKAIIDGVNVWRAKDGEKALKSSTDAFTFAIDNIGTSIGCSAETTAKASSFGGYILNTLSDLAGTFSGLDPAILPSDQKKDIQYVTFGTAGAKGLAGMSKPFNEGLKAQKAKFEKMKGEIEELIRQKEHEIRNPPKVSAGTQNSIESKEQSVDTKTLTQFKNKTTYTRTKAEPESEPASTDIKAMFNRHKGHTKA